MGLGALPEIAVIDVGSYVLFPAFSRLAGDRERFCSAFLRALPRLLRLTLCLSWRGSGRCMCMCSYIYSCMYT